MYSFAPPEYQCPFCLLRDRKFNQHISSRESDIVFEDDLVMSFVCSDQFCGTLNEGHVLVVPKVHCENIFELPDEYSFRISQVNRLISLAMMKAYGCQGVTLWQNNGPASQQTVFHYHVHIIPRFENDSFIELLGNMAHSFRPLSQSKRSRYAEKLRDVQAVGL